MNTEKLTFDELPNAVQALISEVNDLKKLLTAKPTETTLPPRKPILIEEACLIIHKAKPTIYVLARSGKLKSFKAGKTLYFYEDDLLEYINNGRRKTAKERLETAEKYSIEKGTQY